MPMKTWTLDQLVDQQFLTSDALHGLIAFRDQAADDNDLAEALRLDDEIEQHSTGDLRITCHRCQSWTDAAGHRPHR